MTFVSPGNVYSEGIRDPCIDYAMVSVIFWRRTLRQRERIDIGQQYDLREVVDGHSGWLVTQANE